MPIFTYLCEVCSNLFDIIVNRDEENNQTCPDCGSDKMAKQLTSFSNYSIKGNNGASTRPKGGGGRKV